jgi:hypothetical protein
MSQPISAQHPAVVLRSQYRHVRALLAVTLVAVLALAAAVVILATNNSHSGGSASTARTHLSVPAGASTARYDGGPEEGSSGPTAVPSSPTVRYDGGPEEGAAGPGH